MSASYCHNLWPIRTASEVVYRRNQFLISGNLDTYCGGQSLAERFPCSRIWA